MLAPLVHFMGSAKHKAYIGMDGKACPIKIY